MRNWSKDPHIVAALLLGLLVATLAGCLGPQSPIAAPPETGTPDADPPGTNVTAPDPITLSGESLLGQPLYSIGCFRYAVDGEFHDLPARVDDWFFQVEPATSFLVYWWKGGHWADGGEYLGGGESAGEVIAGATHAEVCRTEGIGALAYTVTLIHPDHPDHPEHAA